MSCQKSTIADYLVNSESGRHGGDLDHFAFVALGSNLASRCGSPEQTVLAALTALEGLSDHPVLISSLWRTDPLDCPPGSAAFVNAVAALRPRKPCSALQLLDALQSLEQQFGRQRSGQVNEARVLDLDLISFGGQQVVTERLLLPHPRAAQRRFVLQPLAELAPELVLPGQTTTVAQLLASAENQGRLQQL